MYTAATRQSGSTGKWWLDAISSVAMIIAAVVVIWRFGVAPTPAPPVVSKPISVPAEPLDLAGAPSEGSTSAPIVVVEFSDFECPYCRHFSNRVLPDIRREFIDSGKIQLAFRPLPLPIHENARAIYEAAECHGRQGRFWEMHDQLFMRSPAAGGEALGDLAVKVGIDVGAFDKCRAAGTGSLIDSDIQLAQRLQINGTPTFLVGRRGKGGTLRTVEVLQGARPLSAFREVVERVLAGS